MDEANFDLAKRFVDSAYVNQARSSSNSRRKKVRTLLANRLLPETGWDDVTIKLFLEEIASMDSNNFPGNVGVGEREGRVFSSLVRDRSYSLHHGIGRSGDIGATQPKAAGSSLLAKLTSSLALDASRQAGFNSAKHAAVLPVATGMTMTLVFCALRDLRPPKARKVIFLRIDQKSCVKSVLTAGFELELLDNARDHHHVSTDIQALTTMLQTIPSDELVCVVSTTSCFAPRAPDRVVEVAKLCSEHGIPHVINNAYGIQSRRCMGLIDAATRQGRVDVVVQSTDKNFLVPVGGALLTAGDDKLINAVYKMYPGRASVSPSLDLFVTLLSMGRSTWRSLLEERETLFVYFVEELGKIAERFGEQVMSDLSGKTFNPISIGVTLSHFEHLGGNVTFLGSMLFLRLVSGARVVPKSGRKDIVCGIKFPGGFGAHCGDYPYSYITFACALGVTKAEIETACARFRDCLSTCHGKLPTSSSSTEELGTETPT